MAKSGKTLSELAAEIERQQDAKRDFVAPTSALQAVVGDQGAIRVKLGEQDFGVKPLALRQIGEHQNIPAKYIDLMAEKSPELLAHNINHWFHKNPDKRMVRTLDGDVRAFLSNSFRPLENVDLAEAALPVLMGMKLNLISCELTERRLYIKACDSSIQGDIPKAGAKMGDGSHVIFDTCCPAIVITNSEVGEGRLGIETAVWTKACTNLAIFKQRSMSKYHVGRPQEFGDRIYELLSDKTKQVTDEALWRQVGDVIRGAFDKVKFEAECTKLRGMTTEEITGDVVKVVELTARKFSLSETEGRGILNHLIKGGDMTRYGLFNAVTRSAEDLKDYDRATDFERLGGSIIELPANDWSEIAKAA